MSELNVSWTVIVCCANWCGVCREFKAPLRQLALMRQDHRFVWIDVENTKEWDDEIDIENFPTVLVIDESGHKRFQGPIEPHVGTLAKLLDALQGGQPQALEVGLGRLFAKLQRLFITHSGNYMDLA